MFISRVGPEISKFNFNETINRWKVDKPREVFFCSFNFYQKKNKEYRKKYKNKIL